MRGLWSQYQWAISVGFVVMLVSGVVALLVAAKERRSGADPRGKALQVLAVGSVIVTFIATAFPRGIKLNPWGCCNYFEWRLGGDTLGNLGRFFTEPFSIAHMQFIGNLVLYFVTALLLTVAWPARKWLALGVCLALAVAVETLQFLILDGGVASTDDLVLNMAGAVGGYFIGRWLFKRTEERATRVAAEEAA